MPNIRLLLLLPAAILAGCTSVTQAPEFVARVERIERTRLEHSVRALDEIGPRPIEDSAATLRTTTWIREQLEEWGYVVTEEEVTRSAQTGRFTAQVRRADAGPGADSTEIVLPASFASYGPRVRSAASRRLRAEGWDVEGYSLTGGGAPTDPHVAPNIFAEVRGTEDPERVIEVSAHYDTVPGSSGASDNSSGVAVVLELARVLADATPRKTIRFCFFAAEEAGLLGGRVHVENITRADAPVVEALINLDSIGHATDAPDSQDAPLRIPLIAWMPTTGDFITVIGTNASGWLGNVFEAAADAYVPELSYYSMNRLGGYFADARRSDHAPYWDADIPAIFLTDTGEFRSDTYHTHDDTAETIDYEFLHRVARATGAALLELTVR